jgi:hypothetical protein
MRDDDSLKREELLQSFLGEFEANVAHFGKLKEVLGSGGSALSYNGCAVFASRALRVCEVVCWAQLPFSLRVHEKGNVFRRAVSVG